MDSKQEKALLPETFLSEEYYEDPKITRIDEHLQKRQQEQFKSPLLATSDFSASCSSVHENIQNNTPENTSENTNETPLSCHPAFEKKRQELLSHSTDDRPQPDVSIFSNDEEDLSKNITDLEKQILEKIQADLDPDADHQRQHNIVNSDIEPIENIPAQQIHEELQQVTTNAFGQPLHENQDADFARIKNWLDETPSQKESLSGSKILFLSMCTAAIGVIIGGLIVAFLVPSLKHSDKQIDKASLSYEQKVESAYQSYIANRNQQNIGRTGKKDGGGNDGGNISKAGMALSLPAAVHAVDECTSKPDIQLSPLPAGQTLISVTSGCHANQKLIIEYAESRITRELNENGKDSFTLDCFAGDKTNINFHFGDKLRISRKPVTRDLDKITKVALIWSGKIDLNLHAFEYMANHGDKGHIWEQQPSDFRKATQKTGIYGKGHGFLSTYKSKLDKDTNLEVYTFVNTPEQKHGVIKLALNHNIHRNKIQKINCQAGGNMAVDYTTTLLVKNSDYKTGQAASIFNSCSSPQSLNTRAIQDLVIGR